MPEAGRVAAKVRVWVIIRPDGVTAEWIFYVNQVDFDVAPIPGDVIMIHGFEENELQAVGDGYTVWSPSDKSLVISVRVDKRYFDPSGHLVVDAVLPWDLALGPDDEPETPLEVLWERFKWDEIAQALTWAKYQPEPVGTKS